MAGTGCLRRESYLSCCPWVVVLLRLCTPWHCGGWSRRVWLLEHASKVSAARASVHFLGRDIGFRTAFDVVRFSPSTLRSPFREQGAQGQVFLGRYAFTLDKRIFGHGSIGKIRAWLVLQIMEEGTNVKRMKPSLSEYKLVQANKTPNDAC